MRDFYFIYINELYQMKFVIKRSELISEIRKYPTNTYHDQKTLLICNKH